MSSARSAAPRPALDLAYGVNAGGLLLFLLLLAGSLPVFWYGMAFLGATWITPEYSHGPLIPLISMYLFLRELRDKPAAADTGRQVRWPGLVAIAAGLALGVLGNFAQIPDVTAYGIIVWVGGIVLTLFGWAEGRRHQLPVLHLIFMLPLPGILYWKMSSFLQGISSEIGVWIVSSLGIPVFLNGNIIDLGVYKLHVAEACSGLRYLFPILSFSYLTAILYRGPFWHKILLFASAAPIAVLMNAVRIGMIGVIVNSYGLEHAEGFTHFFEGWVVFLICVGILFLMAIVLQRTTPDPKSLGEVIDLDFRGLPAEAARILRLVPSAGLVAAAGLSLAVGAAFLFAPERDRMALDRQPFALFPRELDGWTGVKAPLTEGVIQALGADDYYQANYVRHADRSMVNFFSAFYEEQSKGEGIHSPEVCLPGTGWEIYSFERVPVSMPDTVYGTFTLNRAVIQRGLEMQLVYYWFEQRGKRMTNDVLAKLSVLVDAVVMGRSDGAIVRYVTPIDPGETEADADARILDLMEATLPRLPRFLPE